MNILVTGGAGFLGQQLIAKLLSDGQIQLSGRLLNVDSMTCFDQVLGAISDARVKSIAGDIGDSQVVSTLVQDDTALVVHLAAVVSGTAEANFDLGMRVNLDGTRYLLDACRAKTERTGQAPIVLFSSSIAAFGGNLPTVVTDDTTPAPQGSYGMQKVLGEYLVNDYSRKGFIDGRGVRVPTVVVRPGKPNGAASGFASGIIREPLNGVAAILPVSPDTEMWVASPRTVIRMFLHALALTPSAWDHGSGSHRVINLPGLVVSMRESLAALEKVAGKEVAARVTERPDPAIERLVNTWAGRFKTDRATAMGFTADSSFEAIVRAHIEDHHR
jgi:D-erythronate 2-dehydrogenase